VGLLFPTHTLYPDVIDWKLSGDLCPTADDVWLNAMCRLNNSKVKNIPGSSTFLPVMNSKNTTLSIINNDMNQNDIQIQITREYCKDLDPFKY